MVGDLAPGRGRKKWSLDIDVKARTRAFEGPADFPFDSLIVEPRMRYERRESHPDWYCVVSQYTYGLAFLPGDTELDVEIKLGREYVTAPKEKWLSLDQFIAQLPPPPKF